MLCRTAGLRTSTDPRAAELVESLLTATVGRDLVSAHEVAVTCDQIETALEAQEGLAADDGAEPAALEGFGTSVSSKEGA